jgi:peroxiredoxin
LQLELDRITRLGATLVAVSPQTPDNSLSTVEKNFLTFEVLSDTGNVVARSFGIVFRLPEDLRPIYSGFGLDLAKVDGDDSFELPLTATYVIDRDRKIRMAFIDPDYTKRVEPHEVLRTLEEIANEK